MKPITILMVAALVVSGAWAQFRGADAGAPHWLEREGAELRLRSPAGVQTVTRLDGAPTGYYYDAGALVGRLRPDARTVVLLGLGGGEMLRAARRALPHAQLVGVELDARTAQLAVEAFHVDALGVEVVVADALDYPARLPKHSVDAVLVDVYADGMLPAPFRRLAFFVDLYAVLASEGVVLMNVWPAALVPEVRAAMAVLFDVEAQAYGPNTVLIGRPR